MASADLLPHPIRLRIVKAFLEGEDEAVEPSPPRPKRTRKAKKEGS